MRAVGGAERVAIVSQRRASPYVRVDYIADSDFVVHLCLIGVKQTKQKRTAMRNLLRGKCFLFALILEDERLNLDSFLLLVSRTAKRLL